MKLCLRLLLGLLLMVSHFHVICDIGGYLSFRRTKNIFMRYKFINIMEFSSVGFDNL
jgi:hypothetical protein